MEDRAFRASRSCDCLSHGQCNASRTQLASTPLSVSSPLAECSIIAARICCIWHSTEQRRVRLAARERVHASSMCVRVRRARRRPATREYSIAEGTATPYHGRNQASPTRVGWNVCTNTAHHATFHVLNQSINCACANLRYVGYAHAHAIYIPKATQPCLCVRLEHDGARSRVPATTKDATFDLGPKWILYKQPFTD